MGWRLRGTVESIDLRVVSQTCCLCLLLLLLSVNFWCDLHDCLHGILPAVLGDDCLQVLVELVGVWVD